MDYAVKDSQSEMALRDIELEKGSSFAYFTEQVGSCLKYL